MADFDVASKLKADDLLDILRRNNAIEGMRPELLAAVRRLDGGDKFILECGARNMDNEIKTLLEAVQELKRENGELKQENEQLKQEISVSRASDPALVRPSGQQATKQQQQQMDLAVKPLKNHRLPVLPPQTPIRQQHPHASKNNDPAAPSDRVKPSKTGEPPQQRNSEKRKGRDNGPRRSGSIELIETLQGDDDSLNDEEQSPSGKKKVK